MFDASNSMNAQWQSSSKISVAQRLLAEAMIEMKDVPNVEFALRVYGHQSAISNGIQDCDDTKLEVAFSQGNHTQIRNTIKSIVPKGTTPIARSLEKSADDFPECDNCRNIIILITDGVEACDEDPCAVSRALREKGIVLKPFVIGIGIDPGFVKTFECVGKYYDASNEATFKNVLDMVMAQALDNTSLQVNLKNGEGKPLETNVPMTFYDSDKGGIKYNFVHTLNRKGNPDTLTLDPLTTYKLVVHTIPPISKDKIELEPGKHNTVSLNAAQGFLAVKIGGITLDVQNVSCIVRKQDDPQTLNAQAINSTEKYLIGEYDLEILTLPRTYINDVKIEAGKTNDVIIPSPGVVTFLFPTNGYGGIYEEKDNELNWVCNLNALQNSSTFSLQPGKYRLIFRSRNSKESVYTIEKNFKITSGSSTTIKL